MKASSACSAMKNFFSAMENFFFFKITQGDLIHKPVNVDATGTGLHAFYFERKRLLKALPFESLCVPLLKTLTTLPFEKL